MNLVMKASKNLGAKLLALTLLTILFILINPAHSLADYYADSPWPTIHSDSRNSDFTSFPGPVFAKEKWTALGAEDPLVGPDGAAVLASVTIGSEGNLYVTTGKGIGYSNLYAFDRNGNYLWSSDPVVDVDDLDAVAIGSSAIVDSEGDVYVSDSNQFWAFLSDGTLKWDPPISIPANFATAFFTVDGYVGGITRNGEVLILNRDDGLQAAPILNLPGGSGPPGPPTPPGIWKNLIDPLITNDLYKAFFGYKFEVTNTPAVNSVTGRIYIAAAGPTPTQGRFYGIDFDAEKPFDERITIAFQTLMGPGSGTSPAISPDGSRVYAADGIGNLYAFDAYTGAKLWMFPVGQTTASPSISPEGVIYSLSDGVVKAIADHGGTAAFLWGDDFKWIATALLPTIGPKSPIAKANSIVSVTSNYLYVTANLGYEVFLPVYQKYFFIPKMTVMLVLNPDDGSPVAPPVTLRDTCDGVITIGYDENIYITHGSTARSITYYSINKFLPPDLKVEKPIGGVSALEPVSFLELAEAGIHWVQNLDAAALFNLDAGNLDEAYTQVHHGTVQLGATANSISDAEELGEIDSQSAQQARQRINTAQTLLNNAKNHIAQARIDPNEGLLNSAKQLIENAEKKLEEALEILAGSAAPPIAKTISKEFRFSEGIPVKSELVQNYPNPFNPETWLPYNLAKDADVIVKIYNVSGQLIRTLDLAHKDAGFYLSKDKAAHWDGRDNLGERVASGIYFYTLKAGDFRATRRMLIMK